MALESAPPPPAETFELTYEVTFDDLLELQLVRIRQQARRKRNRILNVVAIVCLGVSLLMWLLLDLLPNLHKDPMFTTLLAVVILLFFVPMLLRKLLMPRILRSNLQRLQATGRLPGLGRHTLTISPTNLCDRQELAESVYDWRAVLKVVEGRRSFFIYVSSLTAIPVPRSAFADEAACRRFVEVVRRYAGLGPGA